MLPPGDSPSSLGEPESAPVLARLRTGLAREGLHIVLPLGVAAFERELALAGGPSLSLLLDGVSGAYVVGDGGPEFFAEFRRAALLESGAEVTHPLDDHTRRSVGRVVAAVLDGFAGLRHRVVYPFDGGSAGPLSRPLPFQRLGRAAGLPSPGPLGIQIHPRFGPWWAYRALVLVAGTTSSIESEASLGSPCTGCSAPCASACPAHAVAAAADFAVMRCASHRATAAPCAASCAARLACPIGADHRYPDPQLAFHMAASLTLIRAFVAAGAAPGERA